MILTYTKTGEVEKVCQIWEISIVENGYNIAINLETDLRRNNLE